MERRTCGTCRKDFPVEEFRWRNRARTLRHTQCTACIREYKRIWYERNKERHILGVAVARSARMRRHVDAIVELLAARGCIDCGERDPIVLEFDHRESGTKVASVSDLAHRLGVAWEKVLAEIAKCDIRCANCHRRKTAAQFGWYKYTRQVGVV
jgi:hypothetical protein